MPIGLSEAAAANGVNRSTIYRAWKAGRLSAPRACAASAGHFCGACGGR
jgi:predicted site-specific integrase-resolvase